MNDKCKTEEQLLNEIAALKKRVAELETAHAEYHRAELANKQIESEQHQSKQMLQLILDTIPQRVFWKDRNFAYIGCNKSFAKDAGLNDPSEIIGKNDFELGWKDIAHLYRNDDREVMETDTPKINFEEPEIAPDGSQLWLRTNKVPLHDQSGNVIGVLGTYQDITKLKQAEEALRYERNLLRTLIDNLPDGIYVKDEQCRKIIANLADVHNIGLQSEAEVVGKDDFMLFPSEIAEKFIADDKSVIQTGQPVLNREEYMLDKNGQKRWLLTSKLPLRDEKDRIIGLVGIGRDITERRHAEEERERLISELQNAIADIKVLSGLVPICANCKKIRDDKGYWTQLEAYIQAHSQARFSHGVCPDCMQKLYPDFMPKKNE
jgi:PAS domain S-box-containing protein